MELFKLDFNFNLISKIEIILVTIMWHQDWRTELEISEIITFYRFHQKYPYLEFLQNILFFNWSERQELYWFQLCICKTEVKCAHWNLNYHFHNFWPISNTNFGPKSPNIEFLKQNFNSTDNPKDRNHLYNNYGHQTWKTEVEIIKMTTFLHFLSKMGPKFWPLYELFTKNFI